jgi:hypothetical protein
MPDWYDRFCGVIAPRQRGSRCAYRWIVESDRVLGGVPLRDGSAPTPLTWAERRFGYGVARGYADSTGAATTTYTPRYRRDQQQPDQAMILGRSRRPERPRRSFLMRRFLDRCRAWLSGIGTVILCGERRDLVAVTAPTFFAFFVFPCILPTPVPNTRPWGRTVCRIRLY